MNDEINNEADDIEDEDLLTTAPSPQPTVWKMPEPVFRKTSGRLPEAFENLKAPVPPSSPGGTPQDEPGENVTNDPIAPTTYVEPKPKSPALKILVVVLGLAAMIAFIAVFLIILYFLFWRS